MNKHFAVAFIILLAACSKQVGIGNAGAMNCAAAAKSFSADVNPIIQASCTPSGCHHPGSSNGPGPLTTYAQIFAARASIRTSIVNGSMPKNSTLFSAQRNSIICWIDSGAPNN